MSELLYSLPPWDLHNLGSLFNQNFNLDACMRVDNESPDHIVCSPEIDMGDVSTGYLEDALIEFSGRSKRRRLSFNAEDIPNNYFDNSQNNWGLSENYSCTSSQFADESPNSSINICSDASNHSKRSFVTSSSTSNQKNEYEKKKRLVYPFGVVKPGGREDDVTLNDINKRILMPSARPVRHPVGAFACRPCLSAHGPGLSGKAVVAFTKIQTLGNGTITIIRTKG